MHRILILSIALLAISAPAAEITIGWTAPVENEDGSSVDDLAGFNLYQRPDTNWIAGQDEILVPATNPSPGPDEDYEVTFAIDRSWWYAATAVDEAGNESAFSEPLLVDIVAPALALLGDNPLTLERGAPYVEPGWSVSDDYDPAPAVTVSGDVPAEVGSYELVYRATDHQTNETTATRTVNVEDGVTPNPPSRLRRGG